MDKELRGLPIVACPLQTNTQSLVNQSLAFPGFITAQVNKRKERKAYLYALCSAVVV
jgi:hypothetical protein